MFDTLSRYRSVPAVTAPDPQGRLLPGTDFRTLPAITGTYRHVVQQGDRIDQLASTYYSQPLVWWNIADANPDVLSPLALVGAEPVVTTVLPIGELAGVPAWAQLIAALGALPGVEAVQVQDDVVLVPLERTGLAGQPVTIYQEQPVRSVLVTHNDLVAPPELLASSASALGWPVGPLVRLGRLGRTVVIPPVVNG